MNTGEERGDVTRGQYPLAGRTVLVPLRGERAGRAADALREAGARAVIAPLITAAPPRDAAAFESDLRALAAGEFDWLVCTSARGVEAIAGAGFAPPAGTRVAVVGAASAAACERHGWRVALRPVAGASAQALVTAWRALPTQDRGASALLAHSDLAHATVAQGLRALGLRVRATVAYRTVGVPLPQRVIELVRAGGVDAALVTSGSVARQVAIQFGAAARGVTIVVPGEQTAADAREAGLEAPIVADGPDPRLMVAALAGTSWRARRADARPSRRTTNGTNEASAETSDERK